MLTVPKNRISGQASPLRWQWLSLCFHRTGLTRSRMMSSLTTRDHTVPWQQRRPATAPCCSSLPSLSWREMSPLLQGAITDPQSTDKTLSLPSMRSLAVARVWDHSLNMHWVWQCLGPPQCLRESWKKEFTVSLRIHADTWKFSLIIEKKKPTKCTKKN